MNENIIKTGDWVRYIGVTIKQAGLYNGKQYEVSRVAQDGSIAIKGTELNDIYTLAQSQFELAGLDMSQLDDIVKDKGGDTKISIKRLEITKSSTKKLETTAGPSAHLHTYGDTVDCGAPPVHYPARPGSAVVHYKSGETFHLGQLTGMSVGDVDGQNVVAVTRKYKRKGVFFEQTAYIPVGIFDCVIYRPLDEKIIDKEVKITYKERTNSLSYPLTYATKKLDFMQKP